ncbi:MAG: restriction endonuclease subunit S [Alistipes sp.]|nr:restriction endonuclease subunit S [Alistipes sp.]
MKQGWEIKKLGDVGTFQRGGGFIKSDFVDDGYPCIHYGQIHTMFDIKTYKHITCISNDLVTSKSKIAQKGDVIIAITSEDVQGSCKCTAWMGNYDVVVGAHAAIYKHTLNPSFVAYYLRSQYFNIEKAKYTHGFKVVEIKPSDIAKIDIRFPSLAEQERIVEILDREFERIDEMKANAEKSLQHAKDLFQSALKQELQPKEGWETKTISEISENLDYKRVPVTKKDRKEGVYPYYGASGIVDYVDGYLFDEDLLLVSEDGANLLARSTPIAFSVSGKIWVNNHAHILRFANIELQKFVEYFFANYDISKYVTGAAQPKFNQKALNNIVVSYPTDIVEQRKVVSCLDKLKGHCTALEENYKKTIVLCDDMKQALLRKAFNGEL